MRARTGSAPIGEIQPQASHRGGFTFVELTIAIMITSMVTVVIAGLVSAVHHAWDFSTNLEDTQVQASAALERISFAVGNARCYRIGGGNPIPGVAVVTHSWSILAMPDTLVVWNGGRNGFSAGRLATVGQDGHFSSYPNRNELTIFAADPNNPGHLVEISFPSATGTIDFSASTFGDDIRSLIQSNQAEFALLSDRVRATRMPVAGSNPSLLSNVRFEIESTPSQTQLGGVTPGSTAWRSLPWVQGMYGSDFGLRQVTGRTELQLETVTSE